MERINDILKNDDNDMLEEEYNPEQDLIDECNNYNASVGTLNQRDGIECAICKNKGTIAYIKDGFMRTKNCSCMIQRTTLTRMKNCGIDKRVLEHYNFRNWKCEEEWQNDLLIKCREFYIETKKTQNNYWFIVSGQSGGGKTHICTAIFQELILTANLGGIYFMWNDEIPKLLALRKSSYTDNQEKYEDRIYELKNIDVLYIDDLFKLDKRYKEDSLSIAFEILNYRYTNNKITIISTEIEKNQFENLDTAIWGRCNEKTKNGAYWFTIVGKDKNYRIKGE